MLLWPGDERAGSLFDDAAVLRAMTRVEAAWLAELAAAGVAPPGAADPLADLLDDTDAAAVAAAAESGGNPVIPLVALLRERLAPRRRPAAEWLHRGLTSQDVLDSALALCARDVSARLVTEVDRQSATLAALVEQHRHTPMAARTLTQPALPYTFGVKASTWLQGLLDAAEDVERTATALPAQLGGAVGTLAAVAELAGEATALRLATATAERLGLRAGPPWPNARAPFTRLADAWCAVTGAWGRIANDVLTLSRPEIGELAEGGGGGSSTMPHKANPVLSVLIRRAALAAPGQAAQLHLAAADSRDERPDGAWHLEWPALQLLGRRTVTAASQTSEMLAGLVVHADRMAATRAGFDADLRAEQRSLTGGEDGDYLGVSGAVVAAALARARARLDRTDS